MYKLELNSYTAYTHILATLAITAILLNMFNHVSQLVWVNEDNYEGIIIYKKFGDNERYLAKSSLILVWRTLNS